MARLPSRWTMVVLCAAAASAALGGCAPETNLRPADPADVARGDEDVAAVTLHGVDVIAEGDAWRGTPNDLETMVTPVGLEVRNEGDHAIALRYEDIALIGPHDLRHEAIPPFEIPEETDAPQAVIVREPRFRHRRFFVAPHLGSHFTSGSVEVWSRPFSHARGHHGDRLRSWPSPLPTPDMLRQALPEGVVGRGGEVRGFVFFEKVAEPGERVIFQMDLVDAETGEELGEARIPFQAYRD